MTTKQKIANDYQKSNLSRAFLIHFEMEIYRLADRLAVTDENGDTTVDPQLVCEQLLESAAARASLTHLFNRLFAEQMDLLTYQRRKAWSQARTEPEVVV